MVLVDYSDSEASEAESPVPTAPNLGSKKIVSSSSNKIKVDLPSIKPEPGQQDDAEPARKRIRTAGAFSGFNSLLPAPKRTAQNTLKPGVSLKTSSEAAFSRNPVPRSDGDDAQDDGESGRAVTGLNETISEEAKPVEPKIVGKPTRFLPLSVSNAKKKKRAQALPPSKAVESKLGNVASSPGRPDTAVEDARPPPKPRPSLFSMNMPEHTAPQSTTASYEPELIDSRESAASLEHNPTTATPDLASDPNPLQHVAHDLGLSAAERRQLFGRHAKASDINITHFNMDAEYRANQELAAKGEVIEHKAVRAIAPGKHSLQQLVNNVRGQSDALEDKWAEGRRKRGEGGSKYGWS